MAKLPRLQSDAKLAKSIKTGLTERAGITHWAYDSMGRVLSDAFLKEVGESHAEQRRAFSSIQVGTASGQDLDDLGMQIAGLRRGSATFAKSEYTDLSVYFYVPVGTFGDINGGEGIYIPKGTELTSRPDSTGKVDIIYMTTRDYYLSANDKIQYCSVRARTMGSGHNVAENVLQYHNVPYAQVAFKGLKCNNYYPILSGQDPESDTAFRYRITQKIPSMVQNNLANIRMAGLTIPGVKNVKVIDAYFGVGTAGVIVFGAGRETNSSLTTAMQRKLNSIQGPGSKLIAVAGSKVTFDFDLRLVTVRELNEAERKTLERGLKRSFTNAIKDQEFSGTINLNIVASRIFKENPKIARLIPGPDGIPFFEAVYLRRSWSTSAAEVERRKLITSKINISDHEHCSLGTLSIKYELDP